MVSGGVEIYLEGQWYRIVRRVDRFDQFERWEPFVEGWLPDEERNFHHFRWLTGGLPVTLYISLPYYRTSSPIRIKIVADGGEEIWS